METYGIFKNMASDNHYVAFSKCLSSAHCTSKTLATIKRITKNVIKYAHMGQLVINDGICYATFIQNPGDDGEGHDSVTSGIVLAIFSIETYSLASFDAEKDIEFYSIGSKGDVCDGYEACTIYKDNSMRLVGEKLHICFSFAAADGLSHIFRKTFDIKKREWVEETIVSLEYNGKIYDFSDETLNLIYTGKGLEPRAKGLIELVSEWSEYKGEYYATGITIDGPNNGFVVKTSDFKIMQLVDVVPFNDMGASEIASYIFKGKLFVACRQLESIPYMYIGFMDLEKREWKQFYKIPDGNSRPWFFEHNGDLYLLNTIEEMYRRYTNISRVRVTDGQWDFFNDFMPIEVMATIKDCGCYFATAQHNGDIYFVCTQNTESFGKLSLDFYDPDTVNRKLLQLFK